MDIQDKKVDVESVLSERGSDFSVKRQFIFRDFLRSLVLMRCLEEVQLLEVLKLKASGVSKLLSNLVQADIIESVSGHGKGKYKFKK